MQRQMLWITTMLRSNEKRRKCNENAADVQVQHFSLPWGGACHKHPNPPVVDVILPPQCTRDHCNNQTEVKQCNAMVRDVWGMELNEKAMEYPIRYQLDIAAQQEWHEKNGVEQIFITVVRDKKVSFSARYAHSNNTELRQQEEEVGTD